MSDQFSKTISSVTDVTKIEDKVKRAGRVTGGRVENSPVQKGKKSDGRRRNYSVIMQPGPGLWNQILEAVEAFNQNQEVKKSPLEVRLWARDKSFRVQLISDETGELIKQSRPIRFDSVTTEDVNKIINELIAKRGIILDIMG